MPRFVILHHEFPPGHERRSHFDLMLETETVLKTWALLELPTAGKTMGAELLPDHRLEYLEYEGPVSGDRGSVSRWDEGTYETVDDSAAGMKVSIAGKRIVGMLELLEPAEPGEAWHLRLTAACGAGPSAE